MFADKWTEISPFVFCALKSSKDRNVKKLLDLVDPSSVVGVNIVTLLTLACHLKMSTTSINSTKYRPTKLESQKYFLSLVGVSWV